MKLNLTLIFFLKKVIHQNHIFSIGIIKEYLIYLFVCVLLLFTGHMHMVVSVGCDPKSEIFLSSSQVRITMESPNLGHRI